MHGHSSGSHGPAIVLSTNALAAGASPHGTRSRSRKGVERLEARPLEVAIVCPSIGQTRRGYERFLSELFEVLSPKGSVTLLKGAGNSSQREHVVPHLRREGWMKRLSGGRARRIRHQLEFTTFAAGLLPLLARKRFDLVHFIDPALARPLWALRAITAGRFALLFSHAGPVSFEAFRWVDHVQCLTPKAAEEAMAAGVPRDRVTMIPIGLHYERFAERRATRTQLRERYGVPPEAFVVLAVTSLNRHHKRVDFLIEEVARVADDCLLWLDGSAAPDGDATLIDLGAARLGERFRHTHVPSDAVVELMQLADLIVSTALHEPFGMAIVEGLAAGTPVIVHDSEHFRWLTGGEAIRVDMSRPGALAEAIVRFRNAPRGVDSAAVAQFSWSRLATEYWDLYGHVAAGRTAAHGTTVGPGARREVPADGPTTEHKRSREDQE